MATKYPAIAKDYFYNKKHQTVEIIKLNGSIELAPIVGLSEEVAKVKADGTCDLQVGDQVEIIPNHSCSTANNTGWYTCVRGDEIVDFIAVDARENSKKKGAL